MVTEYDTALDILKKSAFKVTKQRMDLLKYLATFEENYVSVIDVDHYMQDIYPNASHATTYRNIKEFTQLGLLEQRLDNGQLYVKFQCDFHSPHHGHFICQNCGRVIKIESPIDDHLESQLTDYVVLGYKLEIYGLCNLCRNDDQVTD
ncbi:Fur family transcriptional regulator [Leuconostoc fallax]